MYKFLLLFFSFSLVFANQIKHILILNSYHQTLSWSQDVLKAIYTVLQPEKNRYVLHIENMDTKRTFNKKYINQLKEIYKEKYKNVKLSLILANDNNAYNFLRKYRDEIFGPVPVVFCGVNFFHKKDIKGIKNFTGVAETIDPAGTVKAALKILPNTKHIFILDDYLNTGRAFANQSLQDIKKLNLKNIQLHMIENLTMNELENKLAHLPKDSIVIMGVYFKDKNKVFYSPNHAAKRISKSSIAPVFVLVDIYLKHEMVGGSVDGGYYQGLAMAKIAKRILNGEDPNKIPVIESGVTQYVFNYIGLKKFGISLDLLPKGSIVINKPLTFYERYKLAIQIAIVIILILLIAIIILVIQNKKVETAKNELQKLKDNLEILVQERTKDLEEAKKIAEELHKHTRDSINYASLIQGAIVSQEEDMKPFFKDSFVYWEPKDTVGGDIWFIEELRHKDECLLFVIDCTGHGVPGAFVTMIVKAIEREIISSLRKHKEFDISPAVIMSRFNKTMKMLLKQTSPDSKSNAGFDGGIIYYNKRTQILKFAGAETPLFYVDNNEIKTIKGNRYSVGYKKCDIDYEYKEHMINVSEGMKFYITTDGFLDQNGGEKEFPFGKKRFKKLIEQHHTKPMKEQKEIFLKELLEYQKDNERNDDITVVAFEIDKKSDHKEDIMEEIFKYEGTITQNLIATAMDNIEAKIDNMKLMGVISTITIEYCQNIMNYSKDDKIDSKDIVKEGEIKIILINDEVYEISARNIISKEDKEKIEPKLQEIKTLDKAGIKKRYRELRKSGKNTHEKGGGIGMYEIAKVSDEIRYNFIPLNENKFIFEMTSIVNKNKKNNSKS